MARKSKKTEALVANMSEQLLAQDTAAILDSIEVSDVPIEVLDPEVAEILAAEVTELEGDDPIEAMQQANGFDPIEAAAEAQAEEVKQIEAPEEANVSFLDALAAVSANDAQKMHQRLEVAFAERALYEQTMNSANFNIQKTIAKVQKLHLTPGIVGSFVAAKIDPDYVNHSEVTGKRRNVYALEKLRDFLYGAVTGHLKNSINIACMTSLVKLKDTALPFTGLAAKACASDKVAVTSDYKGILVRHTVAESTASTQASSTMTALEDLGVVKNSGTRGHPVYSLTDTPLSRRLQQIVA